MQSPLARLELAVIGAICGSVAGAAPGVLFEAEDARATVSKVYVVHVNRCPFTVPQL